MTTRPTRIAQTSREAKIAFKKNGPQIPERERRQLARGAELDRRASRIRDQDDRRRQAKKKKEERERKEREIRRHIGVGLATQMIGYSHTQAQLKRGMEAFVGLKKGDKMGIIDGRKEEGILAPVAEKSKNEPWDDCDEDDLGLDDLPDLSMLDAPSLIDDDLDDETLLEIHDHVMSDPVEKLLEASPEPAPVVVPPQESAPRKDTSEKEDKAFLRLHGPVNKVIEASLAQLPGPLIEFLSVDTSTKLPEWDPSLSLLHKLNPVGLPPHRLRLKVGCTVTVLRDLNTSSQLSKSSNLQILRTEKDRLECLVLDGQLEGTKTFLTRVHFPAKYRNENQSPFLRTQFPIRVSTEHTSNRKLRDTSQTTFKIPTMSASASNVKRDFKKPALPNPKAKVAVPGASDCRTDMRSLSNLAKKPVPRAKDGPVMPLILDSWDDFLDSGTQIARELSSDTITTVPTAKVHLSTQDFDFSMDDLDELALCPSKPSNVSKNIDPKAHVRSTRPLSAKSAPKNMPVKPPAGPLNMKPPMSPPWQRWHPRSRHIKQSLSKSADIRPSLQTSSEHRSGTTHAPKAKPTKSAISFQDFGLSTQDAVSFFDDDELSPTLTRS